MLIDTIWKCKEYKEMHMKFYKVLVILVPMYTRETWAVSRRDRKKIQS